MALTQNMSAAVERPSLAVWLVRYLYAPFMMLVPIAIAILIVGSGRSYFWLVPVALLALALSFTAERIAPYEPEWNRDHDDTPRDITHGIIYEICSFNSMVILPFLTMWIPWAGIVWPSSWPLALQLALAILLADLGVTLIHFWSHRLPILWRFHEIHHSSPRLYGLNGLVRHPVHQTLDLAVGFMPLVLLGLPLDIAVLLGFAVTVQLLLQHSNADVRVGRFAEILAIGPVHRLHHVKWHGEGDVNFGLFFNIWDRMLGTFQLAKTELVREGEVGVDDGGDHRTRYLNELLRPFWRKAS
jgi:sterol desaturase/sphingolipid hydroxylase (fatty acid hydroxylase superfamily)